MYACGIKPTFLRCEYLINPLGIDDKNPRLSWIIKPVNSSVKGQKQTAYQILVSSSKDELKNNLGTFWNSGKVNSGIALQIKYQGKRLTSLTEYWWKVRVWDKNKNISEWSKPAFWYSGLLLKTDWKAKWIFYDDKYLDKRKGKISFEEGKDKWIWFPKRKNSNKVLGDFYFRKNFRTANLNKIKSVNLLISADENFVLFINGKKISQSDGKIFSWARPKLIAIKKYLIEGNNLMAVKCGNSYLDLPGLAAKVVIFYKSGSKKIIRTSNKWKTSNFYHNNWQSKKLEYKNWINADEILPMGKKPWRIPHHKLILPPPKYFRKEFLINKKILKAVVNVSALGLFELNINGGKISKDLFTPGWTDYNKRVLYKTYDVTGNIKRGKNAIGIILADGWYSGYVGWERGREYYGNIPKLIFQLEIEFNDGSKKIITSNEKWKVSTGPILEADLLMGETYDARKEKLIEGWNKPDFLDNKWKKAKYLKELKIKLSAHSGVPVQVTKLIKPNNINEVKPGIFIFDFGQNFAGFVRLKIKGKSGEKITLRFAEMLNSDRTLYLDNIRMARSTDTYILKGEGEEIWEPKFTYHGFRYVELSGIKTKPSLNTLTGLVTHSNMLPSGKFTCSHDKINKIYNAVIWSQRSNFIDIPTDCPQRDERLGWTEDAISFIKTSALNYDISSFYKNWLINLFDAQEKNGAFTAIAPNLDLGVGPLYEGAPGWADAGIISPYKLYQIYGDKNNLEKYYFNMKKYIEYLKLNSQNYIRPDYGYGDWLSINSETPKDLIGTAFFAYVAKLMSEIAGILGKDIDERKYHELYIKIKNAFNREYVFAEGKIKSDTQTSYLLALSFNLLSKKYEKLALKYLLEDIENRGWHFSTGFLGLALLFPVLMKYNCVDEAYKILLNEEYPSWFYMINHGATTLWERWNSWMPEKVFFDPTMNSFNHPSLGVVGEFLYSGIGGINFLEPGFKKVIIKPLIGGSLTFAKASYNSINGKIISDWKIVKGKFYLNVTIPINTEAEVYLPLKFGNKILENAKIITKNKYIKFLREEKNYKVYKVLSGDYKFLIKS